MQNFSCLVLYLQKLLVYHTKTIAVSVLQNCSFGASKLLLKRRKKKKNLKIILKYTFLENSSKHELEEELRGAGREDGSSK